MSARERLARALMVEGAVVAVLFVVMVVFFAASSPVFLTAGTLRDLFVESAPIILVAAGMTCVLVMGGIDLSVGSVVGLSAGTTLLSLQSGLPLLVGILIGVGTGMLVGLINGALIAGLQVNDFIVTLATLSIVAGALQVLATNTQLTGVEPGAFTGLTSNSILGIPLSVILAAVVIAVLEFMLVATAFGRTIYAAGINGRAAYLAGVSARRLRLQVYVLSGSVAGFAGVLLASNLNSVQPGLGSGYELTAIAACVLGGVSLAGGRGSVWRAVLGALFLVTLSQGLQLLGVDPLWFAIVTGASIVAAVAFDRLIQRLAGSLLQPRRPPPRPPADGESEATRAEAPSVPTQA